MSSGSRGSGHAPANEVAQPGLLPLDYFEDPLVLFECHPLQARRALHLRLLGIGVNTAMFSAVDAVLIRPLPYGDAGRLVMIWDEMSHIGFPKHYSTPAEWYEWRRHNTVFTDIAATESGEATLSGDGEPEQVPGRKVTGNLWTVLGAQPLLGRVFTEGEEAQGVRVAVISYGLWRRRFGGARDVLGHRITLNDSPYEVIGVMPREFYFMPARDIDEEPTLRHVLGVAPSRNTIDRRRFTSVGR